MDNRKNIIIHNLLQEIFDKVFDYDYNEFYNYIISEIGINDYDIESLRKNNLYVFDINNNQY